MSKAATKSCPFCAETIKAAALLCRFCGSRLPQAGDPAVPPPVVTRSPLPEPAGPTPLRQGEVLDLLTSLIQK